MPNRKRQIKQETRVDKVGGHKAHSRPKSTELTGRGSPKDDRNASLVSVRSVSQSRRDSTKKKAVRPISSGGRSNPVQYVPVISKTGKPLMPCCPARARELISKGNAVGKWKVGIFYIQLTQREDGVVQTIAVGIDPGSKREAFTVKSAKHTYLNVLADAVAWVKDAVETRRMMRKNRRFRKTPCRASRYNRTIGGLPPSTKARWQAKIRIVDILAKLYPITDYIVEDISATTKEGKRKWNASFSPLEIGKKWFYTELQKRGSLTTKQGYETKELRDTLGLKKTKSKMEEKFSAHNLDSWVLANSVVGGHAKPDNEAIWRLIPLRFHRRQLHYLQATKGKRLHYGSTMSLGIKRGSLAMHPKWGLCYLSGYMGDRVSLRCLADGVILCQNAKKEDLKILRFNSWRYKAA